MKRPDIKAVGKPVLQPMSQTVGQRLKVAKAYRFARLRNGDKGPICELLRTVVNRISKSNLYGHDCLLLLPLDNPCLIIFFGLP